MTPYGNRKLFGVRIPNQRPGPWWGIFCVRYKPHAQPVKLPNLTRYWCDHCGDGIFMDARSAMRPCYILPMFFYIFFYARLSWPNG